MSYLSVAKEAAEKAGKVILQNYGKKIDFTVKGSLGRDFATLADKQAEKAVIETIRKYYPDHSIMSEERPVELTDSEYIWVIDPIDGTTNFSRTIPVLSVSIALAKKDTSILGVVYNPVTKEMYHAEKGKGAFLNNKKISVSSRETLAKSIFSLSINYDNKKREENLRKMKYILSSSEGLRVFCSGAIEMCYVAQGRYEGCFVNGHPWDIAAGSLIIEEAGGKVTTSDGKPWNITTSNILATNKLVHTEILELVSKQ